MKTANNYGLLKDDSARLSFLQANLDLSLYTDEDGYVVVQQWQGNINDRYLVEIGKGVNLRAAIEDAIRRERRARR